MSQRRISLVTEMKDKLSGPMARQESGFKSWASKVKGMHLAAVAMSAGLVRTIKSLADYGAGIYDVARITGVTAERVQALGYIFEQTGGSADSFRNALRGLTTFMRMADSATSEQGQLLEKLGMQYEDLIGLSSDELFLTLAESLSKTSDEFEMMTDAAVLFGGRYAQQVVGMIQETNGDVRGAIENFEDLGIALSGEQVTKLKTFDDALTKMGHSFKGFAADALVPLLEPLQDVLQIVSELAGQVLPVIGVALGPVVGILKELVPVLSMLVPVLQITATVIGFVATGLTELVESLTGFRQAQLEAMEETEALRGELESAVANGTIPLSEGLDRLSDNLDTNVSRFGASSRAANDAREAYLEFSAAVRGQVKADLDALSLQLQGQVATGFLTAEEAIAKFDSALDAHSGTIESLNHQYELDAVALEEARQRAQSLAGEIDQLEQAHRNLYSANEEDRLSIDKTNEVFSDQVDRAGDATANISALADMISDLRAEYSATEQTINLLTDSQDALSVSLEDYEFRIGETETSAREYALTLQQQVIAGELEAAEATALFRQRLEELMIPMEGVGGWLGNALGIRISQITSLFEASVTPATNSSLANSGVADSMREVKDVYLELLAIPEEDRKSALFALPEEERQAVLDYLDAVATKVREANEELLGMIQEGQASTMDAISLEEARYIAELEHIEELAALGADENLVAQARREAELAHLAEIARLQLEQKSADFAMQNSHLKGLTDARKEAARELAHYREEIEASVTQISGSMGQMLLDQEADWKAWGDMIVREVMSILATQAVRMLFNLIKMSGGGGLGGVLSFFSFQHGGEILHGQHGLDIPAPGHYGDIRLVATEAGERVSSRAEEAQDRDDAARGRATGSGGRGNVTFVYSPTFSNATEAEISRFRDLLVELTDRSG